MLESAHKRWLRDQLPGLVAEGVLDEDAAARLRKRYPDEEGRGRQAVVVLFGVLGALLIGGGIILLLAHNWEELSRPVRAALSLLPLLASLALAAWVIASDRRAGWREGVAGFWALSIGASISLVSQTYQISGDWTTFLATWMLLGVAIPYLLRSVTAGLLYLLGLVSWVFSCAWAAGNPLLFWPLLALIVPFVWWRLRDESETAGSELLGWATALAAAWGMLPSIETLDDYLALPLLATGCLALWGISVLGSPRRWERPFRIVGIVGFLGVAFVLSFSGSWRSREMPDLTGRGIWELLVVALVAALAMALLALAWRRRGPAIAIAAAGLPVVWVGFLLAQAENGDTAAVLVNVYLLAAGIALLVHGMRTDGLGRANLGTAIVGVLLLVRFFDTDWGFVVRGAAFIAVGVGFLLVNVRLLRRREAS